MAPKRAAKSVAKAPATNHPALVDATTPASGSTAARKRQRAAPAAAVEDLETSTPSVMSVAASVVDVDEEAPAQAGTDANAASAPVQRRRQRQITLSGDVVPTPPRGKGSPRAKTARAEGDAVTAASSVGDAVGVMGGGELQPSKVGPARGSTKALPGPAADDAKWQPVLERAIVANIRSALTSYTLKRSKRTIAMSPVAALGDVTDTPEDANEDDGDTVGTAPGDAGVEGQRSRGTGEDADDDADGTFKAANEEDSVGEAQSLSDPIENVQGYLALPCVQYFILKECARLARVVRETGGNGFGNDPSERALELLGLFLIMTTDPVGLVTLLTLACPSCRALGLVAYNDTRLFEYLVLSQRVDPADVFSLTQKKMEEALRIRDGCYDDSGMPLEPLSCCPFGESHAHLQLVFEAYASSSDSSRNCALHFTWVPYGVDGFAELSQAAILYRQKYDKYTDRLYWAAQQYAYANGVPGQQGTARQKGPQPPSLPQKTVALLAAVGRETTWAERMLQTVLPNASTVEPRVVSHREMQSRIRAVFAHTCDSFPRQGGFFKVRVEPSGQFAKSPGSLSLVKDLTVSQQNAFFTAIKAFQHIAEAFIATSEGDGGAVVHDAPRCLCGNSAAGCSGVASVLMEAHEPYMQALRHSRYEQHLLVDPAAETAESVVRGSEAVIDVDDDAAAHDAMGEADADTSYYAAGSYARFHATLEATENFSAAEVVDYVTRLAADGAEALPASAVPRQYIRAELKRHQLEDVQAMWAKETDGFREHVLVPLYQVALRGAAASPVVKRVGEVYHCAATHEMIVQRHEPGTQPEWSSAGAVVRGGLLCDDVGLGKTLSVLALCAYDRAVNDDFRSETAESAQPDALSSRRFWRISGKQTVTRNAALSFSPRVLEWGFGPGTFGGGGAAQHLAPLTLLPRTTLVVVPLSIATQWIEELRKFYPAASYVLFYGAKRTQYTAADLRRADFVITTYETLSTHLRQEADGAQFWLARRMDAADDAACAEVCAAGLLPACRPSQLRDALQRFAAATLWSVQLDEGTAALQNFIQERRVHLIVHQEPQPPEPVRGRGRGRGLGRGRGTQQQASDAARTGFDAPTPPQPNAWVFEQCAGDGSLTFRCPAFTVRLSAGGRCAASDSFLDSVWDLLKGFSAAAGVAPGDCSYSAEGGFFDLSVGTTYTESFLALLFHSEQRYPMTDVMRRLFVRHALLPSLWRPLQEYWRDMRSHAAAVAVAEASGQMPLRLLDLHFRRIVLDESQKCGPGSLFHLLRGERRWAVTGTPLNNNKTESLGAALAFVGMTSAAQLLSSKLSHGARYVRHWMTRHRGPLDSYEGQIYSYTVDRARTRMEARRHRLTRANIHRQEDLHFCICATCTQKAAYGCPPLHEAAMLLEYRAPDRDCQCTATLPCLPNTFMEILAAAMVRHERTEQIACELQLAPVQYVAHRAELLPSEMRFYDGVARVIMRVAAQLHRQGLLGSRMGYALQWVQELCRLCLHPSRVGEVELLRGDIEAHVRRAAWLHQEENDGVAAEAAAAFAATFVEVTPTEALEWAVAPPAARPRGDARSFARALPPGTAVRAAAPEETVSALQELVEVPPVLPVCGVCMDDMVAPTLLGCYHLFCKECLVGVIDASRGYTGRTTAKCPYCRDPKSLLEKKLVIKVDLAAAAAGGAGVAEAAPASGVSGEAATAMTADEVDAALAQIGDGSRVRAFVELVQQIWRANPGDGVLVFSKYPAFLQMAHDAIQQAGYAPFMVRGASTLVQRQRVMRALQQPGGADPVPHRILFVTSRSANAGLNLTFANHVVFLEPNLNPAMEQQAVGRVHRFGQLKQVTVHHLYAPHTIEDVLYWRSVRLRRQAPQDGVAADPAAPPVLVGGDPAAVQRRTQFGRIAPAEISLLLEYPVPPHGA